MSTTTTAGTDQVSLFAQPKAVYAVAFACVISFMGIGLVDPILPSLRTQLKASPSQVTLLFTSYLVVTAFAMLVTNWVSSRLGAKRTLVTGLAIIVVFSALAGTSDSINGIVGFRAGWGLGNALFIATSLAVIVASATGGFDGAIVLYEAALGLGIAVGPLLGGTLGNISWRGPFFGVAALMAVALIAIVVLLDPVPLPTHHTSPVCAIEGAHPSRTAHAEHHGPALQLGLLHNAWVRTVPDGLSAIQLGLVFFGWGLLVAFFSVFGAPRLQRRYGTARSLYAALLFFAADLAVISIFVNNRTVLVVAVITAGIFIGINNTLTTQAVMMVSPVERPVASAAYGFVRFLGGGLAPFAAGKLVERFNLHVPFAIGALAVVAAVIVLSTAHQMLAQADRGLDEDSHLATEHGDPTDVTGEIADELGGAGGAIDSLEETHQHATTRG
jgi:MFS transporter, ACDE family, multidrug resistance protein